MKLIIIIIILFIAIIEGALLIIFSIKQSDEPTPILIMRSRMIALKTSCECFYTEYDQYPRSLNELKGVGDLKINKKRIKFYTSSTDDDWTENENDYLNILVDSDLDGKADKLLTGDKVGTLSPLEAGVIIVKNVPVIVYTNKADKEIKVLSTND